MHVFYASLSLNSLRSYRSGWKQGQTDRCVRYVKQASAEIKWSRCMGEVAQVSRIPGKYSRRANTLLLVEIWMSILLHIYLLWDFRERTPPRPQGQRPEPENRGVSSLTLTVNTDLKNVLMPSCKIRATHFLCLLLFRWKKKKDMRDQLSGLCVQLCNTSGLVALAVCDETITWGRQLV